MPQNTPNYVLKAFESLPAYNPEFDEADIICLLNTDIEIYTVIISGDFHYFQATTYLNTNDHDEPTLTCTKL